jgi:hypothetical protein
MDLNDIPTGQADGYSEGPPRNQASGPELKTSDFEKVDQRNRIGANRLHLDERGVFVDIGGAGVGPRTGRLRQNVEIACMAGEQEVVRYAKAQRALDLMRRYPEVAELIELLREF